MKQITRFNTFETNSSSVHSLILVPNTFFNEDEHKFLYVDGLGCDDSGKLIEIEDYTLYSYDELVEKLDLDKDEGYDSNLRVIMSCDYYCYSDLTNVITDREPNGDYFTKLTISGYDWDIGD